MIFKVLHECYKLFVFGTRDSRICKKGENSTENCEYIAHSNIYDINQCFSLFSNTLTTNLQFKDVPRLEILVLNVVKDYI